MDRSFCSLGHVGETHQPLIGSREVVGKPENAPGPFQAIPLAEI